MSAERQAALRIDCPNGCGHSWWTVGDDSYACAFPHHPRLPPRPVCREADGAAGHEGQAITDPVPQRPLFHAHRVHAASGDHRASTSRASPLPDPAQCRRSRSTGPMTPWHRLDLFDLPAPPRASPTRPRRDPPPHAHRQQRAGHAGRRRMRRPRRRDADPRSAGMRRSLDALVAGQRRDPEVLSRPALATPRATAASGSSASGPSRTASRTWPLGAGHPRQANSTICAGTTAASTPAHLEPVTSRENTRRGQTLPAMAAARRVPEGPRPRRQAGGWIALLPDLQPRSQSRYTTPTRRRSERASA